MPPRRYAIIIPACNEEACLGQVLAELHRSPAAAEWVTFVGVNGTTDQTLAIAIAGGAFAATTPARGYGYGCQAAIDLAEETGVRVDGYIFLAGDGASDPADIPRLIAAHRRGFQLVLGCRTTLAANHAPIDWPRRIANRLLGLWCTCLTGRFFRDLGPLRLIDRELFHALDLREWCYGWTIEAQVRAVLAGASICEIPVRDRPRLAGEQKVSRVSCRQSACVGLSILAAGWRSRWRKLPAAAPTASSLVSAAAPMPLGPHAVPEE